MEKIEFSYNEFEKIVSMHTKDMKDQAKRKAGLPQKVIVYSDDNGRGFKYQYKEA
jgi:hypothetical protein